MPNAAAAREKLPTLASTEKISSWVKVMSFYSFDNESLQADSTAL
jgi:hypothetical protein